MAENRQLFAVIRRGSASVVEHQAMLAQLIVEGLAGKAEAEGVRILTGVAVTGLRVDGGAVTALETDRGTIETDYVIAGVGPWVRSIWQIARPTESGLHQRR